jgi:aspartyl-tRNA(Asn)/glutamyl-tRNA(Gln) amidotransferase subunit B
MQYEPVIGLEVHAELSTRSKMFCSCQVIDSVQARPNVAVCPVCAGMPGVLPVLNQKAVEYALRVAVALECQVAATSIFARKNYFYPDLPKGYQISQYEFPLAEHGILRVPAPGGRTQGEKAICIRRVHLEEDTGKLTHVTRNNESFSLVDLNRAGVPLLEIVSEPDMHSPEEARAYAMELRTLLRTLEVNSGDMEKGVIRFEANVSLRPVGRIELGTRVEIKNLNSFRALERSCAYEIQRQALRLDQGEKIVQETLGWDEANGVTVSQRSKEEAHDYRYFPEPDLPELDLVAIREAQGELVPELPQAMRARFMDEFGFSREDATIMTDDAALSSYTEEIMSEMRVWLHDNGEIEGTDDEKWDANKGKIAKLVSGWLLSKLGGLLIEKKLSWNDAKTKITAENFGDFLALIYESKMNSAAAQIVLAEMLATGKEPESILEEKNLGQQSSADDLKPAVEGVLNQYVDQVVQYKAGKVQIIKFLVGAVMKATNGKANPQVAEEMLKEMMK